MTTLTSDKISQPGCNRDAPDNSVACRSVGFSTDIAVTYTSTITLTVATDAGSTITTDEVIFNFLICYHGTISIPPPLMLANQM